MSHIQYEKLQVPRQSLEIEASESLLGFRPRTKATLSRTSWWIWLVHSILLAGNIIAAFFLVKAVFGGFGASSCIRESTATFEYEPLQDVITYQPEYFDGEIGKPTIYAGNTPEVQAAWDEITAPPGKVGIFKLQKAELQAMNLSSIPLADGSGYAVTIDVFHQLHCLDWVRKAVDETDRSKPLWQEHTDHCIDSIRQSLQCHADTSILTYKWLKGYAKPWPDFRSFHTCRDFEAIKKFALERWFDPRQPGIAVHPEFGPIDWTHHSADATYVTPRRPYQYLEVE